MIQEALDRGNWHPVIDAHRLERPDSAGWLRYRGALLHTLQPGRDVGKQQQQAALAFVQAQREGASAGAVAAAQRQLVPGMHRSGTTALVTALVRRDRLQLDRTMLLTNRSF